MFFFSYKNKKQLIMKNFALVLFWVAFTLTSYSQGGVLNMIEYMPECIEKQKRFESNFNLDNPYLIEELESRAFTFIANNKLYMVSYEPIRPEQEFVRGVKKERSLCLWRLDDNVWTIASTKPIRDDYHMIDENATWHKQTYFPWRYACGDSKRKNDDGLFSAKLNGYVKELPNGVIEMKLIYVYNKQEKAKNDNELNYRPQLHYYNVLIRLVPANNEMYTPEIIEISDYVKN